MKSCLLEVSNMLESTGYKLTMHRKNVLKCLLENRDKHLSAEEIYMLIKQYSNDISFATVYRALDVFEQSKVLQHMIFRDGCKRYHLVNLSSSEAHDHLVCEVCGRIIDVKRDHLDVTLNPVLMDKGFIINDQKIQLFGICDACLSLNHKTETLSHEKDEASR